MNAGRGKRESRFCIVVACALSLFAGCSFIDRHAAAESKSPLGKASPSPDSVTLEIFFARAAEGNASLNGTLWGEIDEQRNPAEVRRKLVENGFRAGVVGSHVPDDLARMLTLTDKPQPKGDEPPPVNLEEDPNVTLRLLQTRTGKRNEVLCSNVYDELPLLKKEQDQIHGQTYRQADGRLSLKSFPETPNRVRLELIPELHHGEQQPRWVGSDGMLRLDAGKPREVFDDLRMSLILAPGEMLVMTCAQDRPGTLGHYFFTQPTNEKTSQKLLVIRVSNAGSDTIFSNEPAVAANVNFGE